MVREAPLRQNRSAPRNNAGHARGGKRNVAQQHAGVDREVVDALFGLLDQRIAEEFPGEIFGLTIDLLERLINRHGADRHGRVSQNPLTRFVNVLAGGQVHYGIRAPARRPRHLLDFLVDRRGDDRVADVRVDLHQEVAADDHRLGFGMVDVRGYDGTTAGNFGANELGGNTFAYRNELHLGRDLAAPRVV